MSTIQVRPFRRDDRDQVTSLVRAHVSAVIPGMTVSVNAVLSQLEREPGEFIVDPWVAERVTLVAEQRDRIVAATHLLHYRADADVGATYRDAGEIRWFVAWPPAPFWPDAQDGSRSLIHAAAAVLDRWGVATQLADFALPAPGVYGIPDVWPHVAMELEQAGFRHDGPTEVVLIALVSDLARPDAPLADLGSRRSVGINGTRLTARMGDEEVGYIEVDPAIGEHGRLARSAGWADIGNLWVAEPQRRRGVAPWLMGVAAEWLELGGIRQVLAYAGADEATCLAFLGRVGFRELCRTRRGWTRQPGGPTAARRAP